MEASSQNQEVDILESALDQAFAPPPRQSLQPEVAPLSQDSGKAGEVEVEPQPSSATPEASAPAEKSDESWKEEYEAQVQSWRAQSAEGREKAEKERLKWEAIRAIEKEEAAKRKAAGIVDEPPSQPQGEGWETVGGTSAAASTSASPPKLADLIDLEADSDHLQPSSTRPEPLTGLLRTHSQTDTATDESQKWEDVPSVTSSFPSMTFPEHTHTPPPHPHPSENAPVSVTLAIFDSSLSTRTRLMAFFSSLAINLFLPFVNGVMLGFGEIFAKNFVMEWLGWKGPASVTTNVGIRSSPREARQKQANFR